MAYVPSFGRPEPAPPAPPPAPPQPAVGVARLSIEPVLDTAAWQQAHDQIKALVAQAVREGFEEAITQVGAEQPPPR